MKLKKIESIRFQVLSLPFYANDNIPFNRSQKWLFQLYETINDAITVILCI